MPSYVGGYGNPNAKLMIVGEAPGSEEDAAGIPLVGPTGKMTRDMVGASEFDNSYRTNVYKYRPPGNKIELAHLTNPSIHECEVNLWREITTIQPWAILALGNVPLRSLTGQNGIKKWRGSILESRGFKVIPTIHPAALLKPKGEGIIDWSYKPIIQLDIDRAVKESKTKEFDRPNRNLQIARRARDLELFIRSFKGDSLAAIDIEAHKCVPICISIAFNPWNAISVPLMNPQFLNPIANRNFLVPHHELVEIYSILAAFLNDSSVKLIGQNIKYDLEKLVAPSKLMRSIRGRVHADTSLMAGTLYPEFPRNLAFLTSIFTREPFYKDDGKEFDISRQPLEVLMNYNNKDSCVTYEIYQSFEEELREVGLHEFYYNYQNRLHDFYMDLERPGIRIDTKRRDELWHLYTVEIMDKQKVLEEKLGHDLNIRSPQQVAKVVYGELGLPPRGEKQEDGSIKVTTNEDTLVALMANHCEDKPEAREIMDLILHLRGLYLARGTFIEAECDYDGRMRTSYRIL